MKKKNFMGRCEKRLSENMLRCARRMMPFSVPTLTCSKHRTRSRRSGVTFCRMDSRLGSTHQIVFVSRQTNIWAGWKNPRWEPGCIWDDLARYYGTPVNNKRSLRICLSLGYLFHKQIHPTWLYPVDLRFAVSSRSGYDENSNVINPRRCLDQSY